MTETIRSADGTTIAFDSYGDGPPLILVGGAFQHRAIDQTTAGLAARLGERFTVLHYDRRGRGDSTDTAPWAVEREVEDLAALVEHVGGEALGYGMSSGGGPVIDGGASPPWAHECAEAVAAAVPGARRHTIPGETHEVSTDALAPVLLDWF